MPGNPSEDVNSEETSTKLNKKTIDIDKSYCAEDCRFERQGAECDSMLQCVLCENWWHFKCVNITTKKKPLGLWLCKSCEIKLPKKISRIKTLETSNINLTKQVAVMKTSIDTLKEQVASMTKAFEAFAKTTSEKALSTDKALSVLMGGAKPKQPNNRWGNTEAFFDTTKPNRQGYSESEYSRDKFKQPNIQCPLKEKEHEILQSYDIEKQIVPKEPLIGNPEAVSESWSTIVKKNRHLNQEISNRSNMRPSHEMRIPHKAFAFSRPDQRRPPCESGKRQTDSCALKPSLPVKTDEIISTLIGNCSKTTNVEQLKEYIKSKGINLFSISEIKRSYGDRKCFLIKTSKTNEIMKQDLWPVGIRCSQYVKTSAGGEERKVIWGANDETQNIHLSGQPNSLIYVGGCDLETNPVHIKSYLVELGVQEEDITDIRSLTKNSNLKSKAFVIEAPRRLDSLLLSCDSWPPGINFRRFQFREDKSFPEQLDS